MSSSTWSRDTKICLPHPYLTRFRLLPSRNAHDNEEFQLSKEEDFAADTSLPVELHDDSITFTEPKSNPVSRASTSPRRSSQHYPTSVCTWQNTENITINHIWLIIYTIFTTKSDLEVFQLNLRGSGNDSITENLRQTMMVIISNGHSVVFRNAFWQGCASPLINHSIWTPLGKRPLPHLNYVTTSTPMTRRTHPLRSPKPTPGTVVYSRYIPTLDKTFSLLVLDHQEPTHVEFYHQTKKSPTTHAELYGDSLEEDYEYLRRQSEDLHKIGLLGQFDGTLFGYFEVFWAKEDSLGVVTDAGDFDRGLSGSVGYSAFKSRRWLQVCWSSLLHYIFLDDSRTENIIGDTSVVHEVLGDISFEILQDEVVELQDRQTTITRCSRELFFGLSPFDGQIDGTLLKVTSHL
ncbi:uncharacterized protein N7483_004734 [Penicillium malachiteum]|uniref:uncharacterized protein n=1 Tax=Penicillium malachiteum TaxID=1324776 RepID=UPI002546A3E1|nr:uncharacterized protein N7483_004734 [Penicillium malachiteum]KAJ5730226.1 hypothetical protein N7483_004734 [Penicillium malachiteum]